MFRGYASFEEWVKATDDGDTGLRMDNYAEETIESHLTPLCIPDKIYTPRKVKDSITEYRFYERKAIKLEQNALVGIVLEDENRYCYDVVDSSRLNIQPYVYIFKDGNASRTVCLEDCYPSSEYYVQNGWLIWDAPWYKGDYPYRWFALQLDRPWEVKNLSKQPFV